jgi:hypothetical protein
MLIGGRNRPTVGRKQADKKEKGTGWQVEETDQHWETGWQEGKRNTLTGRRNRPAVGNRLTRGEKEKGCQVEETDQQWEKGWQEEKGTGGRNRLTRGRMVGNRLTRGRMVGNRLARGRMVGNKLTRGMMVGNRLPYVIIIIIITYFHPVQ